MKSKTEYQWNGHTISVTASASPKFLWLDYSFDVWADGKKILSQSKTSLLRSSARFKINHHGINTYGKIISSGFPFTPIITQATILDDSIIGHSQMWVKNRHITYAIILAVLVGLGIF